MSDKPQLVAPKPIQLDITSRDKLKLIGHSEWHARRKQNSPKCIKLWGVEMELKSLRLLIVDDEEAARYGMRRALETFGCDIAEAESAEHARARMQARRFDLVLLDVNLPGLSGLEFLKEILEQREQQKNDATLVVNVTAR